MSGGTATGAAVPGGTTERPTWFGPEDARLFGVVHQPSDGVVRGAVVLCPAVGYEQTATAHGLRMLGEQLAARGLLALRFDYRGTGQSSGRGGDVTTDWWLEDVRNAVRYVRAGGAERVGLVGLRMGALLAARVHRELGAEELVLWDPITSGRRYLREEQFLLRMTVEEPGEHPDLLALAGWSLPHDAVAGFKKLRLPEEVVDDPAVPVMAALRSGVQSDLAARVTAAGGEVVEGADIADFVAPTEFVPVFPRRTLAAMVDWLSRNRLTAEPHPVELPVVDTAVVDTAADGTRILERLRRIGPHRLFGVETLREGLTAEQASAEIVFHSTANDRCVGQGRMWPELAREFASSGVRSLRFDRRGVGDSPGGADGVLTPLYTPENLEDITDVDRDLVLGDGHRLHTGLCAGAWMSTKVCLARPGTVLCAIGPLMWMLDPPRLDAEMLRARGWDLDMGRAPLNESAPSPWKVRLKTWIRTSMPYPLWRLASRTGRVGCPEEMLRALIDRKVPTTVVFPAGDRRVFELQRGSDSLRVIGEPARVLDFRDLDGDWDDHVLMGLEYRLQTAEILREVVGGMTRT